MGFLKNADKSQCFGCEACVQICGKQAVKMREDTEGFRYPEIDKSVCINCGACIRVCPYDNMPEPCEGEKYAFGGYSTDSTVRFESTSGGAFSEIARVFCDDNYVIFGAGADGLNVFHSYITDIAQLSKFRKSKYSQSVIGSVYKEAKQFLCDGKKVLFSGTPCQIAGLKAYLGNTPREKLLTVEVICEGVPSPLYARKLDKHIAARYGEDIKELDYRYKGHSLFKKSKWDFQIMKIKTANKVLTKDRWFNPFWQIWINHLMSRPSCYKCPFTKTERYADITLGDLWGVHLYCPELYGENGGASLVICNSSKGKEIFRNAEPRMYGHELNFEDALKYQSPMRKNIGENPKRNECMSDLASNMSYREFVKKWYKKPSLKLIIQKYIWGNRQKMWLWNLKNRRS